MGWRLAESLVVLRNQINSQSPNRNKASDGTIGDPNHQAEGTGSQHNPNAQGVVCAFDITNDPSGGMDVQNLADNIANSKDARVRYMIFNRRIMVPTDGGWVWKAFSGDPHTSHLHISVWGDYDNKSNWNIGKKSEMKITRDQVIWHYRLIAGVAPTEKEINGYVGKDYYEVTEQIKQYFANAGRGYDEYIRKTELEISKLKEQANSKPSIGQELKPGTYIVK